MFKIINDVCGGDEHPYISVILTAFNRKEYILEAIKSVLNQTLERSKYEIIVVKNYLDDNIDKVLSENNVINIYTDDVPVGAYFVIGMKKSKGEIICFLDDDDLFFPNKLEVVYYLFRNNTNVVYVKNKTFDTSGPNEAISGTGMVKTRISGLGLLKSIVINVEEVNSIGRVYHIIRKYGINKPSTISIRKRLYIEAIKQLRDVNYASDLFLFFWAIFKSCKKNVIIIQAMTLSIYRVHDSWTQVNAKSSFHDFTAKNLSISKQGIEAYEKFKRIFQSNFVLKKYIDLATDAWKVQLKLTSGEKCTLSDGISLFKVGFYKRDPYVIGAELLVFISRLNPDWTSRLFLSGLRRVQSFK